VNKISLQNKFPSQHVCREFLKMVWRAAAYLLESTA
jgi:hypothetical protein